MAEFDKPLVWLQGGYCANHQTQSTRSRRLADRNDSGISGVDAGETTLIEIKLALGESLRQRRRQQMTQAQLAQKIQSSQPRIARAEQGDKSVSFDLLLRAILATGATPQDIGQIIADAGG